MQGFGTRKGNIIHYHINACKQTGSFRGDDILTCNKMKIYLHQYMTYYTRKPHKIAVYFRLQVCGSRSGVKWGSRRPQSWVLYCSTYTAIATKRSVTNDKLNTVVSVTVMILNQVCDTDLINYAKITSNIIYRFRMFPFPSWSSTLPFYWHTVPLLFCSLFMSVTWSYSI
jgi:hypothetical protein